MLNIKGETRGEYFHVECADCGAWASFDNLRWVGGVPQVEVTCSKCNKRDDLKLHAPTWVGIFPPG